jgi:peroxiredoxin
MPDSTSTTLLSGAKAPSFRLPDPQGKSVSSEEFSGSPALLVAFICNHCPFVKHIQSSFAALAKEYQARGAAIVAISSNDAVSFPDDGPEKMAEEIRTAGYTFPYLYDESQDVARAYGAVCTPDFFLFDRNHRLAYRGQFDGSRPKNDVPVSGADLRAAFDAVLEGRPVPSDQKTSVGCSIKWKPANSAKSAG